MLIIATKKSRLTCCSGCQAGKPCCGSAGRSSPVPLFGRSSPRFEQRGGLILPKRPIITRSMLGYPSPLEWPGGRFWPGLPPWVQFDMSCLPCCGGVMTACCDNALPEVLSVAVTTFCGTYNSTLEWTGGTSTPVCWSGTVDITCRGGFPIACNAPMELDLLVCCVGGGGWTITQEGSATVNMTEVSCNPLQLTVSSWSLLAPCSLETAASAVVTG